MKIFAVLAIPSYKFFPVSHLWFYLYAFLICSPFVALSLTDQLFEAIINYARTINGTRLYGFKTFFFVPFFFWLPRSSECFSLLELGYKGA